jgi:hypothetical protein
MNNDMIRAEEHRDLISAIEDIGEESVGSARLGGGKPTGLHGILASITALTTGVLGGLFGTIIAKIKAMQWYIKIIAFFDNIGKTFARIKSFIVGSKLYQKVEDIFSKMGKIFGGIGRFFGKIGSFLGKVLQPVFGFIRRMPISKFIGDLSRIIGKVFSFIVTPIKFLMKLFGSAGALKKIFKIGKGLARLLSKLALPITIIMAIVESVIGAFKGYKTDGVIGAIKGGLKGLLNGLFGWLIDIPKDLISWMLNMFGFENASKWLDSWNFASLFDNLWEMFSNLWDQIISTISAVTDWWKNWSFEGVWQSIKDFFFGIWDSVIDWLEGVGGQISDVFGNAANFLNDFYKSVLRAVLPDRNKELNPGNPMWLISKLIPDPVYDWANSPSSSSTSTSSNAIKPMPGVQGGNLLNSGSSSNIVVINDYSRGAVTTNVSAVNAGPRGMAMNPSAGGSAYTR